MKFSKMVATPTLALVASVNAEVTSAEDCQMDYYRETVDLSLTTREKCEALVVFSKCLGQFPADDAKEAVLFQKNSETCAPYWDTVESPSVRVARDNMQLSVDNAKDIEFFRHRRQSISVFKMEEKITGLLDTVEDLKDQLADQKKESEESAAATLKVLQDKLDAKSEELDEKSSELERKSSELETQLTKGLDTAKKALDAQVQDLDDKLDDLEDKVDKSVTDADASIEKFKKDAAATNVVLKKSLTDAVDEKLKPIAGAEKAIAALKTTRYNNPKIPVFRVAEWHTYNQRFWHDGNTGNAFGGIRPSDWTDGSRRADQMSNDFKYLARLFTKTATASTFGGTVCAEMFGMTSSTNGLMCGALFRIKNTGKSTVRWSPKHTMTSFTGWGESASITVNGNNQIGNRNCQNECRDRKDALNIPANSAGNRISTVIFLASSSYPSSYWRSTLLIFGDDALTLPDNLEYVDDLDTVKGAWKK